MEPSPIFLAALRSELRHTATALDRATLLAAVGERVQEHVATLDLAGDAGSPNPEELALDRLVTELRVYRDALPPPRRSSR